VLLLWRNHGLGGWLIDAATVLVGKLMPWHFILKISVTDQTPALRVGYSMIGKDSPSLVSYSTHCTTIFTLNLSFV